MIRMNRVVPLIGLTVVAVLTLTGCSLKLGADSSEPSPKPSTTASATPSPSPTNHPAVVTQPSVTDAESSATLDESLWGHLTWKYPTRFVDLVNKYSATTGGMTTTDKVTRPTFMVGSNLPGRVWTDSVRPPIATKSMEEIYAYILSEPDYGAHVGSGLAHSSIVGGKSLLELNPWLKEFADPAGINDWAQAAMDGSPAEQLIAAKKLALVVMLLEQLNHESVGQHSTSFNYHLVVGEAGGAMTVNPNDPENTVKEFELNRIQYVGEFVTVQLTFKGQTGCWLQVGFNTGDGRFAGFNCETPTVTPPPSPGCVVTITHSCTTTNTPGCKEKNNCVPPTCTVPLKCLTPKDPKNDVTPPVGTTPLGPDTLQPTAPPAKTNPLNPTTPTTGDSGTSVPVKGVTPAPSASPAPVVTQAPTPSDPGTPIRDSDG